MISEGMRGTMATIADDKTKSQVNRTKMNYNYSQSYCPRLKDCLWIVNLFKTTKTVSRVIGIISSALLILLMHTDR